MDGSCRTLEEKRIIDSKVLKKVSGGATEEEYYAEYEKFGLIDTEDHLLEGKTCRDCSFGKLRFWKYQPGPFGNKEAVYYCGACSEYTIAPLRK
ncbi:MAG: hypothetical protein IKS32_07400 [Solobacterium sp.]|nr:hypothetical protein [Solobacterium sp.]